MIVIPVSYVLTVLAHQADATLVLAGHVVVVTDFWPENSDG